MILVRIDVPMVNESIDFSVDESGLIAVIKKEVVQILHKKYGDLIPEDDDSIKYDLYVRDQELLLADDDYLQNHVVTDGSVLLLV